MLDKIKSVLVVIIFILICIVLGMNIIIDCQKAVLQNSISDNINHQNEILSNQDEINDELFDVLKKLQEE
jgi:predicted PurR-regulated permease PerM